MGYVPPFSSHTQTADGVARIAVSGELDLATAPVLYDQIVSAEAPGVTDITLDLQDMTFLDGSGLRALLAARSRADANGHRLLLVGATAPALRLFELTGTRYLLDEQDGDHHAVAP